MALRNLIPMTAAATARGRRCGEDGRPHTLNPFRLTVAQARRHFAWLRGWKAGRAARLKKKELA